MAEIPIERRDHRGPLWLWLIGVIAVVLLIWLATGRRHSHQMAAMSRDTASSAGEVTTPVPSANTGAAAGPVAPSTPTAGAGGFRDIDAFSTWISSGGLIRTALRENEYTAGGIRRLADALESQGASGASIDNMRKQADDLQNSRSKSDRHGDMARSAFLSASDAFDSLSHGQLNVSHVRDAADAVKPGTDLLRQRSKVQAFFQSARSALQQVSSAR